jgi:hypothetical protein
LADKKKEEVKNLLWVMFTFLASLN